MLATAMFCNYPHTSTHHIKTNTMLSSPSIQLCWVGHALSWLGLEADVLLLLEEMDGLLLLLHKVAASTAEGL